MKSWDAVIKLLARQETKIDNALKVKPNQNQNNQHMFKMTNPIIVSKGMKTPINRKAKFTMSKSNNRSKTKS